MAFSLSGSLCLIVLHCQRDKAIAPARQQGYYPHAKVRHFLYQRERQKGYYHVFEYHPEVAVQVDERNIPFTAKNPNDWKAFEFDLPSGLNGRSRGGSEGRNLLAIYSQLKDDGTPDFKYIAYDDNSRGGLEHSTGCYTTRSESNATKA